jgi:hypothetical protein
VRRSVKRFSLKFRRERSDGRQLSQSAPPRDFRQSAQTSGYELAACNTGTADWRWPDAKMRKAG